MTPPNFSKTPKDVLATALSKGYVSLHIEQGVPVLDRDLNLLGDLISSALQRIVRQHIGDGVSGTADFAIGGNGNPLDFTIGAGSYLAAGRLLTLPAGITYLSQIDPLTGVALPLLTAAAGARSDTVYLDVWTDEVDDLADHDLANGTDIGLRTSTRTRAQFVVRVAENAPGPPATVPAGHAFVPIGRLNRAAGDTVTIADLRVTQMSVAQVVQRMTVIEQVLTPVITRVQPSSVRPGQPNTMTIDGLNLNLGGAAVTLGGVPAVVGDDSTATELKVKVPAAAVPGEQTLIVQTLIGSATAPSKITVQQPPPPPTFVAGPVPAPIVPSHAAAGTPIVLNGTHFARVNRVTFNATPAVNAILGGDLIAVTDTAITVSVPSALSAAIGSAMTITVSVDGEFGMATTSTVAFTVDLQSILRPKFAPTGQISPATQARGGQVVLKGENFGTSTATTTVTFLNDANSATAQATDFVSISPQSITVKIPVGMTVNPPPGNLCRVAISVQGSPRIISDDTFFIT